MPTDLLRRTAIAYFDQIGGTSTVTAEKTIGISMASSEGAVHMEVYDMEDFSYLVITVPNVVSFPDARAAEALTLCNEVNMEMPGKFHMDPDNDITYVYEWDATENSGPEDFRAVMAIVMATYKVAYRRFMTVRWANVTIGEAKKMLKSEVRDNDGGGPPPLGDKLDNELKQLLEVADSDSPEEDGTDGDDEDDGSSEDDESER